MSMSVAQVFALLAQLQHGEPMTPAQEVVLEEAIKDRMTVQMVQRLDRVNPSMHFSHAAEQGIADAVSVSMTLNAGQPEARTVTTVMGFDKSGKPKAAVTYAEDVAEYAPEGQATGALQIYGLSDDEARVALAEVKARGPEEIVKQQSIPVAVALMQLTNG